MNDSHFMRLALDQALRALERGDVPIGAVAVRNGEVIGQGVTLYCTLEPCAMCAGAMVLARLPRLVYATPDPKAGAAGSLMDILRHPKLNHQVEVSAGLMADEAAQYIRAFFAALRADGQRH
jgi:tRNA(adenine34) deaminase